MCMVLGKKNLLIMPTLIKPHPLISNNLDQEILHEFGTQIAMYSNS